MTEELYNTGKRLKNGSDELYRLAKKKAETERDYRLAMYRHIMELRGEGHAVTLVGDLARGRCAQEKFNRDLADLQYVAAKEGLENLRVDVSALQTIMKYQNEV